MKKRTTGWESFIISLDILIARMDEARIMLRIFHYQPWYTYPRLPLVEVHVENLSLSALIYLNLRIHALLARWESFIISLDILTRICLYRCSRLRIFHYQPWYTYRCETSGMDEVENLSLSALIYLAISAALRATSWESFIISLDILTRTGWACSRALRIFHYQPWYTYPHRTQPQHNVENLSLSALIYLNLRIHPLLTGWESFIISLDILIYHCRWLCH